MHYIHSQIQKYLACTCGFTLCLSHVQPLSGDWRQKVKAVAAAGSSPAAAASSPPAGSPPAAVEATPAAASSKPDLAALSEGLSTNWKALWDKTSGEVYYGNVNTKVRGLPMHQKRPSIYASSDELNAHLPSSSGSTNCGRHSCEAGLQLVEAAGQCPAFGM